MYLKMRDLLLLSILCLSIVSGRSEVLPARDQSIINELKNLGENLLKTTLNAELSSRLAVAQLIIDSNVAQKSVIEGMHEFITQWRPVLPRVSLEDYAKFNLEFRVALDLKVSDGVLSNITRGAFRDIKAKAQHDIRERLTTFKDIAIQKMAEVSKETKEDNNSLMNTFQNFVNQRNLSVRYFITFLTALREF